MGEGEGGRLEWGKAREGRERGEGGRGRLEWRGGEGGGGRIGCT